MKNTNGYEFSKDYKVVLSQKPNSVQKNFKTAFQCQILHIFRCACSNTRTDITGNCCLYSQVYEVGAHVRWLWHFHASLYDAVSNICMEEYHLYTNTEGKKKMNKNQLQICKIYTKLKSVVLSEVQQVVFEYLHTAVGQWHCVCIARHALLLTVIGTGCWSPRIAHVCVVWVYRLSPWPEEELRHRDSCEGDMLNFQGFLQNIRTIFFFFFCLSHVWYDACELCFKKINKEIWKLC